MGTLRDRQGDGGRPVIDYDHYSSFHARNAIGEERQLRHDCPIAWSEHSGGFWILATHELVTTAMRDYETFSSAKTFDENGVAYNGVSIPPSQGFRMVPVEIDPPEWNEYRRILNPLFAPPAVERMEPVILAITTEMINRVIEKGEADLLLDLANPITGLVTLQLLGLPLADWYAFAHPIHLITYSPVGSPGHEEAVVGIVDIIRRFRESIAEHRRQRSGDLIGYLIDATMDDVPLSDDTLVDLCFQVLAGGVDTTTALLGNTFVYLDQHPLDRDRLATDEALLRTATEEFLRVFAPLPSNARTVARPTELGGQQLCAGERVLALLGSANRDATIFEDPDKINLDRLPNRHTSFGIGIHRCLGSNLARAMFRIIVTQVLRRMPDYRIVDNGAEKYESIALVNGYVNVRVKFTPGGRVEGGVSI